MSCRIYFDSDDFGGDGTLANPFFFDRVLVSSIIETQMNQGLAGTTIQPLGTHTFTTYSFIDDVKISMAYDLANRNAGVPVTHRIEFLAPSLGFAAWTPTTNGNSTQVHDPAFESSRNYLHEVIQNAPPGSHSIDFRIVRVGANAFGPGAAIQFNVVTEVERFL